MRVNNISAVEFMKMYKGENSKGTSSRSKRSRAENSDTPPNDTRTNVSEEFKHLEESTPSRSSRENRYTQRRGVTEKLVKQVPDKSAVVGESISKRKYSNNNIAESKDYKKPIDYTEKEAPKVLQKQRSKLDYDRSDVHLSEYAESMSAHSSVMSSSSKDDSNQVVIPPIIKVNENNLFDMEEKDSNDFRMMDMDVKSSQVGQMNEFTDEQRQYIANLLDEKLTLQKEKLTTYFHNMQMEMLRQFQIQYMEIEESIENAVQVKKHKQFANYLEPNTDKTSNL